ncbi:MADF domain containing protein [Parasponia andersonii]|uniref:MADF domain containing protein n=1 Tax=Parasponia andersonii TaxID=3476 RepID=A0A2P5CCQ6_PARAD|nr:MADF domain containing protein [Parasponia andersonii]
MASPSSPPESPPPPGPPQAVPLAIPAPPLQLSPSAQAQSTALVVQAQAQPQPTPSSSSRRLPPPCWSHDETMALIDSYRDKWYSLRRGNLKATHWQEVADAVSARCPSASPAKTAVQCRHKMEKLRKRYRTELQRARSLPVSRFTSSWVHFKRMDSMEKGPTAKPENSDSPGEEEDHENEEEDEDQDQQLYEELKYGSNMKSMSKLYRNGVGGSGGGGSSSSGFRIRIPTGVSIAQPGTKAYAKVDPKYGMHPNSMNSGPSFGTKVVRECNAARPGLGKREREREREKEKDPVVAMVSAIKALGDGFVRMEQMKMEMAREIETMRMEMEMKRTEMILESQQRIVEAFAKAVSEKKKKTKRMPSPEA